MQTIRSLLGGARVVLEAADVENARLDARLLLQHVAALAHGQIIAEPDLVVDEATASRFVAMAKRRAQGEPISRILGVREFYGRAFSVSPAVLDPRPDTETLVEACLALLEPQRILDLGTGSGILAVTLLAEFPRATGVAVDLSKEALGVARDNAHALGVSHRLEFIESRWFENVGGQFDLIVSNPPYIASAAIAGLETEVRDHDPHLALDGGLDGLEAYRRIAAGATPHMADGAHVVVEIGAGQAADVKGIFTENSFAPTGDWRDLGGHIRALAFNKTRVPERKPLDSPAQFAT